MKELAVAVHNGNKNDNAMETIDAIKKAGFQNVFVQWYNKDWHPTQEEQLQYIKEQGLHVIFAHLGYQNINDLWLETSAGDSLVERYQNDIRVCKEHGISMVVMHLTSKKNAPMYNETGVNRLRQIVDYAKTLGVKVAFENTKIRGYLEYVMEHLKQDNVGICFDSGHYHCHFDDDWDLSKFKDRIFAIHLHDNDTSDDQHLLPFDGTLDWKHVVKSLKECHYDGPITLEICYRKEYLDWNIVDFYKKGYEIGEHLIRMFE